MSGVTKTSPARLSLHAVQRIGPLRVLRGFRGLGV